jgi:hypothetical protein
MLLRLLCMLVTSPGYCLRGFLYALGHCVAAWRWGLNSGWRVLATAEAVVGICALTPYRMLVPHP